METWSFEADAASTGDVENWTLFPAAGWTLLISTWANKVGVVSDTTVSGTKSLGMNAIGSGDPSPYVKAGMTRTTVTLQSKVKILAETSLDLMLIARAVDVSNFYSVMLAPGLIQFETKVGGSIITLGTRSYTWLLDTVYTVRMDLRPATTGGHEARAWVNGVEVIPWTNLGSALASGAIGIKTRQAHAHFDDVVARNVCP